MSCQRGGIGQPCAALAGVPWARGEPLGGLGRSACPGAGAHSQVRRALSFRFPPAGTLLLTLMPCSPVPLPWPG